MVEAMNALCLEVGCKKENIQPRWIYRGKGENILYRERRWTKKIIGKRKWTG